MSVQRISLVTATQLTQQNIEEHPERIFIGRPLQNF